MIAMKRDYSNYGSRIQTIRNADFKKSEAPPRIAPESACLGVIDGVHCPIRVSCTRYHSDATEFVIAQDFSSQGHKELGCNEYRWILPDDSKSKILTFGLERGIKHGRKERY